MCLIDFFREGFEQFSLAAATRLFQMGPNRTLEERSDSITSNADLRAARMWPNAPSLSREYQQRGVNVVGLSEKRGSTQPANPWSKFACPLSSLITFIAGAERVNSANEKSIAHDLAKPKLRLAAAFGTANRAQRLLGWTPYNDGSPTPLHQADAQSPESGALRQGLAHHSRSTVRSKSHRALFHLRHRPRYRCGSLFLFPVRRARCALRQR